MVLIGQLGELVQVAMMRNGHIEQFDTPEAICQRPATTYVASFFGALPMNMLAGTWAADRARIDGSDVVSPVPRLAAVTAERITIGIRPETLTHDDAGQPFPLLVDVCDMTGPELIVTGRVGSQKVVARLPASHKAGLGEMPVLRLARDQILLFDTETGRRVNDDRHD